MRRIALQWLVLAVLMLAVTGGVSLAEDGELTIEGLAEQVAALSARIRALEELYAEPWAPDVIFKDNGVCQSPLHTSFPRTSLMNSRIRQETADSYRAEFGVSVDPMQADLVSISFGVETSHVYFEYEISGKHVVEKWAHCEFLGHSEWTD